MVLPPATAARCHPYGLDCKEGGQHDLANLGQHHPQRGPGVYYQHNVTELIAIEEVGSIGIGIAEQRSDGLSCWWRYAGLPIDVDVHD